MPLPILEPLWSEFFAAMNKIRSTELTDTQTEAWSAILSNVEEAMSSLPSANFTDLFYKGTVCLELIKDGGINNASTLSESLVHDVVRICGIISLLADYAMG
jgi:hypothetical protein